MSNNKNPLGELPIKKLLKKFSVPSIIAMLVSAFYNIISNFIDIYNSINDNKIKLITMGQISHCDINDILSKYFPILDCPISCNDNRRVVMPSEYNHFLIWNNSKNKLEGNKND